jgi:hypothetical protein
VVVPADLPALAGDVEMNACGTPPGHAQGVAVAQKDDGCICRAASQIDFFVAE